MSALTSARLTLWTLLINAPCLLSGCAPTYDSVGDTLLVSTQSKIDSGFARMKIDQQIADNPVVSDAARRAARADAEFSANIGFYADALSSLAILQSRFQSSGEASGPKEADAVGKISTNVTLARDAHAADGMLPPIYINTMQQTLDQQFVPLQVYELQVKAGRNSN